MENQHRKIKGYRELSQEEIDLMNEIKQKGVELGELHTKLYQTTVMAYQKASELDTAEAREEEYSRLSVADPHQWLREGKQKLQEGLMCWTRSIAQPGLF